MPPTKCVRRVAARPGRKRPSRTQILPSAPDSSPGFDGVQLCFPLLARCGIQGNKACRFFHRVLFPTCDSLFANSGGEAGLPRHWKQTKTQTEKEKGTHEKSNDHEADRDVGGRNTGSG